MRLESITFTRFLAAISIVVIHYGRNIIPFRFECFSFLFGPSNIAVSYFFTLSGFVMIIAYGSKLKIDILNYYKNRLAKIYPVYLLAILSLLIFYYMQNIEFDYNGMILNLIGIQSWIPGYPLSFNYPGWSLSVEFSFYAIFPIMYNYIYTKYDFNKIFISVLLFWILSQIAVHYLAYSGYINSFPSKQHDLTYYFPLMHLNEFLIGNIAGIIFIRKYKDFSKNTDWLILVTIIIFFIFLIFPSKLIFHNGLLVIVFIPLIILLSINDGIVKKVFSNNILVFLGEISYGIYILQFPVHKYSYYLFSKLNIYSHFYKFYLYLFILILISSISYKYIETPLRKYIKNIRITAGHSQ
jgi:peptidoglycan/LPS O-acetylase OafA/YrhL